MRFAQLQLGINANRNLLSSLPASSGTSTNSYLLLRMVVKNGCLPKPCILSLKVTGQVRRKLQIPHSE